MTSLEERQKVITFLNEETTAGARLADACLLIGLSMRTSQRWRVGGVVHSDQRPISQHESQ
jgi:putative transposase